MARSNYALGFANVHYGPWTTNDILLYEVDTLGAVKWTKVVGGSGYEDYVKIYPRPGTIGFYLAGRTTSTDFDFFEL